MNKNNFKIRKTSVFVPLILLSSFSQTFAAETVVLINTNTQKFIGENSVLHRDRFFNLHSTPTSSDYSVADVQFIKEGLNAGFGRGFWGPMSASGNVLYPSTEFALEHGPKNVESQKVSALYPFVDRRVIATEHPANVMRTGNDPIEGARWAADYFENYYDDDTRPLFYEPMNEPFVHAGDFVEGGWDPEQNLIVQDQMTQWFKEIGLEFDRRGIDTNIIGYSSAWPSMELGDFSHWEERQKRFMDIAGEAMDAFSFHLYDGVNVTGQDNIRSGSNAEAIMDLIETYSHFKWDKVKPHALSEYGGIVDGYDGVEYSAERSSQELPSLNHLLFSALAREDRILTSIPFITGKASWFYQANNFQPYSATVWRPDPDKIYGTKVNGFLLTEKAKFYQLWSEVKGNRIDIQEQDPDLASQAFVYGPKVYLALNNLEDDDKSVELSFANGLGDLTAVRIKRLNVPYGEAAIYTDEVENTAPSEIVLAAHETAILEYQFSQPIMQNSIVRKQSYYAYEHLQPIVADQALSFQFEEVALNLNPYSFTDYISSQFVYDEAKAKAIKPQLTTALTKIILKLNRSFETIVKSSPTNWQNNRQLAVLVNNATNNRNMNLALQHHFYHNGFNSDQGNALLRMSIGRKHDKSKQPEIMVNGRLVNVPNDWAGYDQAARGDFFGAIDVPFPAKYLKQNNNVDITFPDSDGRVSSLILEVDNVESMNNVSVTGIALSASELTMKKDITRRLHANVLPKHATDQYVMWVSSNPSVVTVDQDGILTPVQPGSAIITATTHEGEFSSTTNVEVLDLISVPNTVTIIEDTSDEISSSSYRVKIAYSTDTERDISLEMRSPTNEWLGESRVRVYPGEGETEVVFNVAEALPAGTGYKWNAGLRAVDGNWTTNVDGHSISGIVIHDEDWTYTDDSLVNIVSDISNLMVDVSYKVTIQYTAVVESDITLDFSSTSLGWLAGTRRTVQPGTGEVELTVWPSKVIEPGSDYRFISAIREVGGNWQTNFTDISVSNITIHSDQPEPDTNLLIAANSDFENGVLGPWGLGWDSTGVAEVVADETLTSNYVLKIDTTLGKIGVVFGPALLDQTAYQAGKQLKISFDARRESSGGWIGGFAQFWNNGNGWVGSGQSWFEVKNTWTPVEFIVDGQDFVQGSTNLQLNFNATNQVFYIDNIKVEDVTP